MALSTGQIRQLSTDGYYINGRIVDITPSQFKVSADGSTGWTTLTSLGEITNLSSGIAGGSPTHRTIMVPNDVSVVTFKLDNDTTLPQQGFELHFINCMGLPDISVSRVKNLIGESTTTIGSLLMSDKLNPCSPRISRAFLYIPSGIDPTSLPAFVGNSDKTIPHSLGELAGYCHTATAGFNINFGDYTIPYSQYTDNSSAQIYGTVVKNQIPIAGDLDTTKWNRVKIDYPTGAIDNLNFNNVASNVFNSTVNAGTYNINTWVYDTNNSVFIKTNTKAINIISQSVSDYITNNLGLSITVNSCTATLPSKTGTISFQLKITNLTSGMKTVGGYWVWQPGSATAPRQMSTATVDSYATVYLSGSITWNSLVNDYGGVGAYVAATIGFQSGTNSFMQAGATITGG